MKVVPKFNTFANLWTLWDYPGAGALEWTCGEKVKAIAGEGFQGVMGEPISGIGAIAAENGLQFLAFSRLDEHSDFDRIFLSCLSEGARLLQVHLGWHDTPLAVSLELALRLREASLKHGLKAVIESHRDTSTETPEKILELQQRYEAKCGEILPVLWDFSHLAVVKHLDAPFDRYLTQFENSIADASCHHLRPFNGHHAQVPVLQRDGRLTPEFVTWLDFCRQVLAVVRSGGKAEVWVCPEVGPVRGGYGLSTFQPAWEEAKAVHRELRSLWESFEPYIAEQVEAPDG